MTESVRMEKTSEIFKSKLWTPCCQPDHGTECHVQAFLKHFQGWSLPGQPILTSSDPFCEVFLSNVQPIPPLVQLKTMSSHPVTGCLGEGPSPDLTTPSCGHLVLWKLVLLVSVHPSSLSRSLYRALHPPPGQHSDLTWCHPQIY